MLIVARARSEERDFRALSVFTMPSEYVSVKLSRDNHGDSWGFTIAGGKDVDEPLTVQYVS